MLEAIDDLIPIAQVSQLQRLFHRVAIAINPSADAHFLGFAVKGAKLHGVSFHQACA